jgi:hypothetical protein
MTMWRLLRWAGHEEAISRANDKLDGNTKSYDSAALTLLSDRANVVGFSPV